MRLSSGNIILHGLRLNFAGGSDKGRRKKDNEDSFALLPESGMFCVADGVGGLSAGAEAAERLIRAITEAVYEKKKEREDGRVTEFSDFLGEVISTVNQELFHAGLQRDIHMATTLVALHLEKQRASLDYVGDSRAYLYRGMQLHRLTRDHSMQNFVSDHTVPVKNLQCAGQHVITRAIGCFPTVQSDSRLFAYVPGDHFLLCSDGLTDMVTDTVIAQVVKRYQCNSEAIVRTLITLANANGGRDNVTVVVVTVDREEW